MFNIRDEYLRTRPIVSIVLIDNYDELTNNLSDGKISNLDAQINETIQNWLGDRHALMRKVERNRYLLIFENKDLTALQSEKFALLESIRAVVNPSGVAATVSLGIGKDGQSFEENYNFAMLAIEMSLSRGGDQAVIKDRYNFTFFGGRTKETERRTKVKSRVVASSLSELIAQSSQVFIMGHKNSDLDSVGSAVGMWAAIHKGLEKPAHVVLNGNQTLAGPLVEMAEEAYPEQPLFVSPLEALQSATDRSLLIVVDTHSVDFVESRELLERVPRVVVIDHHRMMVSHIKNALIFYHEPYASSASEMVTELAQYIKASSIDAVDAQALLAGIMLDTNNFVMKTGVRTFEASAFLRRRGADTIAVKKLFSDSLDTYKQKSQLVSGAEIYKGCAIATSSQDRGDLRIPAAQAADELLSIRGVQASFVLYRSGGDVNISARSLGDVNVQVILEEFGGGGHFTMAGAQIKNTAVGDVRQELVRVLDGKLEEVSAQS